MDKDVLKTLAESGITINGDLVLEKHVEHEIGNVEKGGIGVYYANGKKPPFDEELTVGLKHGKVDVTIATESRLAITFFIKFPPSCFE